MNQFPDQIAQWLCPPGEGVFTVHTAKEKRHKLQQALYQTTDPQELRSKWEKNLGPSQLPFILGIPSDCGGGILRGANWGPLYIREQLLQDGYYNSFQDLGDVRVIPHLLHDKYLNQQTLEECRLALYKNAQLHWPVSPLSIAEETCHTIYQQSPLSIIGGLGGDHSVSYPLVKAWLAKNQQRKKKSAILHFDAHTDLLEKRLGIDLCFGTWANQILSLLDTPSHLAQVGIRSSGQNKQHWEKTLGVKQHWASDVFQQGAQSIAESIAKDWKEKGIEEFYLSFDIDALDINYAAATGTAEDQGLHPHHVLLISEHLATHFKLTGFDLVEVAPRISPESLTLQGNEPYKTLMWSSELFYKFGKLVRRGD